VALQRIIYTDTEGRKKIVLLPAGTPETEAEKGIPVGPPSLAELNLPTDIEVRLNNELFHRNLIEPRDLVRRRQEVLYAIQSALKLDVDSILAVYVGRDYSNARTEPAENKPDAIVHNRRSRQSRK
jgi:hypothetical protein